MGSLPVVRELDAVESVVGRQGGGLLEVVDFSLPAVEVVRHVAHIGTTLWWRGHGLMGTQGLNLMSDADQHCCVGAPRGSADPRYFVPA